MTSTINMFTPCDSTKVSLNLFAQLIRLLHNFQTAPLFSKPHVRGGWAVDTNTKVLYLIVDIELLQTGVITFQFCDYKRLMFYYDQILLTRSKYTDIEDEVVDFDYFYFKERVTKISNDLTVGIIPADLDEINPTYFLKLTYCFLKRNTNLASYPPYEISQVQNRCFLCFSPDKDYKIQCVNDERIFCCNKCFTTYLNLPGIVLFAIND